MATSKRAAGRELNHDNWNDEEEGEDAGEFKKATEEELRSRVRKVAKRRVIGDAENAPVVNPFSGFGGFKTNTGISTSTPAPNASAFSFLAKIPSTVTSLKTNGNAEVKTGPQIEYLSNVKALNVAVVDWIKTQIDENPLCFLTPIFAEYEKYLKNFEELKKKQKQDASAESRAKEPEPKPAAAPTAVPSFSFGKPSVPASSPPLPSIAPSSGSSNIFNSFKFGADSSKPVASPPKPAPTATESKGITFGSGLSSLGAQPNAVAPAFSFGLQNPLTSTTSLFGGLTNASSSFSFGSTVQASKSEIPKASTEEDAEEEPPKNEFVPVVEDDSLFSKRCKVFVKGASDFSDRGVGTLYIKKIEESKIQMIVRADTNLGNILLNVMLVDGLPVSRLGKNNVMVVCVPTPESKPPPTSVLLRVKTGEEADDLLATINKYKK